MKYLLIILLTGCAANPYSRMYNSSYEQDSKCLERIGAKVGYCDKGGR